MKSKILKTLLALWCSIGLAFSGSLVAHASEPVARQNSTVDAPFATGTPSLFSDTPTGDSIWSLNSANVSSVEVLFTKYISLDEQNYMHVNIDELRNSQYAHNVKDLQNFVLLMNELHDKDQGYAVRDGWSFAKCVIADAVGVNMVARLTNGLYTAIRAAQWPLAAKTILQIAGSAGLNLGWKANAVGLAIALGKSAFYCRSKW